MQFREPSLSERRLLRALASRWPSSPKNWVQRVAVRSMADGGMGSLELLLPDTAEATRKLGRKVADVQFKDSDGVEVIASLNVDEDNMPFELDVWKTDFSPLIRIPESFDTTPPVSGSDDRDDR